MRTDGCKEDRAAATSPRRKPRAASCHWAFRYGLLLWFLSFGRERAMRSKQIALANLKSDGSVLDVGGGTGTLALAAKRDVGFEGRVSGIDASPEMIARACKKAARANLEITFDTAAIEAMPFPDTTLDVVVSSAMLHHLPDETRRKGLQEVRRLLKLGGRMLAINFGGGESERRHGIGHHPNHAHFSIQQVIPEMSEAGLCDISSGKVGVLDLWFVRSSAPLKPAKFALAHVCDWSGGDARRHFGKKALADRFLSWRPLRTG